VQYCTQYIAAQVGGAVVSRISALNLAWKNSQATTASAVVIATVLGAASIALPAGISLQAMLSVLFYSKGDRKGEARCRPELLTVSGFSAGANLLLGISQSEGLCPPAKTVKASVSFYAPVSQPGLLHQRSSHLSCHKYHPLKRSM
jgi:hypothetical protein